MTKTVSIWILVGAVLLSGGLLLFSNVNAQTNQVKRYSLDAGPCAAKGYPMTIQSGYFTSSSGGMFPVPSGHHLNGKWGLSSRSWAVGDPMQPVPERLTLLYFSYLEDKFYQGDFTLPTAKITALLEQGFWDYEDKKQVTYSTFTVCVLPKGAVVVWLTGAGKQVVLSRFQARESVTDAQDFKEHYPASNRTAMFKESLAEVPAAVRAEVAAGTLSAKKWDQYLVTYPWLIEASQTLFMNNYNIGFLSAAYTAFPISQDWTTYTQFLTTPAAKAVPERISLDMTDSKGRNFVLRVDSFDEAQTQGAFQTLQRLSPGAPITLWLQIDPTFKKVTLVLQNATRKIPLDKSAVHVIPY